MTNATARQFTLTATDGIDRHIIHNNALIGREVECSIHINSSQISRYHAKLYFEDGQLFLHDLDSSNGTFVNGTAIKKPTQIEFGDQIAFHKKSYRVTSINSGKSDQTEIKPITQSIEARPLVSDVIALNEHQHDDSSDLPTQMLKSDDIYQLDQNSMAHTTDDTEASTIFLNQSKRDLISTLNIQIVSDPGSGPRLIALTAPVRGKCYPLIEEEAYYTWSIGRNEYAEIPIPDISTSRLHAYITKIDSLFEVKAEDTVNGLQINGQTVAQHILTHDDIIQVGKAFFIFRNDKKTVAASPQFSWFSKLGKLLGYRA